MTQYQMAHNKYSDTAASLNKTSAYGSKKTHISISYGNSNEIEMCKAHPPQAFNKQIPMCHFFRQGRCNRGSACCFSHQVQHPVLVKNEQFTPSKAEFPTLCNKNPSVNTHTGTEYKNMACVPAPKISPRQPWEKINKMVVLYRQVKNGKFTNLVSS